MFPLNDLLPPFAFAPDALPITSCAGHTRGNRLPRQALATFDVFDMCFEGL